MFDRRSIGVITLSAALCLSADCAQAFDDATYPDLKANGFVSPRPVSLHSTRASRGAADKKPR